MKLRHRGNTYQVTDNGVIKFQTRSYPAALGYMGLLEVDDPIPTPSINDSDTTDCGDFDLLDEVIAND